MNIVRVAALIALTMTLAGCSEFMAGGNNILGGDKDCSDFVGRVWVGNNDPHNLDADGDGWGCE
jgi:hypothetical protein